MQHPYLLVHHILNMIGPAASHMTIIWQYVTTKHDLLGNVKFLLPHSFVVMVYVTHSMTTGCRQGQRNLI